jgi:hypothetical protein
MSRFQAPMEYRTQSQATCWRKICT